MNRTVWIAVLTAGLALSACDDASTTGTSDPTSTRAPQSERMLMADAAPRGGLAMSAKASAPRMQIGRSYDIEIFDGEVAAALAADRLACLKLDCVITSVNTSKAHGRPTAMLHALVPQDKAGQFHDHLQSTPGRDVTSFNENAQNREEHYQNIKARLERLEFMRKRLYVLADKKSEQVGELLQVERELLRVDTDIERLTRERKGLEKVTDNVTFTVAYSQRPPKAGDVDFSPFTGLLSDALNTFLNAIRTTTLWIARWMPVILLLAIGALWLRSKKRAED